MECCVCFDEVLESDAVVFSCKHIFHKLCICKEFIQQRKNTYVHFECICPYCRQIITDEDKIKSGIFYINNEKQLHMTNIFSEFFFDRNMCCVLTKNKTQCNKKMMSVTKSSPFNNNDFECNVEPYICMYHKNKISNINTYIHPLYECVISLHPKE